MTEHETKSRADLLRRWIILCVGLILMAVGVAFSIKAALGTSPISSVPFVTSVISGLSVGETTIIMNAIFVLIQIGILRRKFEWFQLLQLPASVLFGVMIDVVGDAIAGISYSNYFQQWLLCIVGILLLAFGVSLEVEAGLITNAGEGIVLAICKVRPVPFGTMKVGFDVSLVAVACLLSFLFLGGLYGVREGTVAAAILVGMIARQVNRPMKRLAERCLA